MHMVELQKIWANKNTTKKLRMSLLCTLEEEACSAQRVVPLVLLLDSIIYCMIVMGFRNSCYKSWQKEKLYLFLFVKFSSELCTHFRYSNYIKAYDTNLRVHDRWFWHVINLYQIRELLTLPRNHEDPQVL